MKRTILMTALIGFCVLFNANAQDIKWKKNFGLSSADDFGRAVIETSEGDLVIAGYTGSYGAGGYDVWLIKTDRHGDTLWTKTYGGTGDDYAYTLKQTEDGGYIIGGATESYSLYGMLDGCIIKTDENGNQQWIKVFGTTHDDYFFSVEFSDDEGYIIAGERDAYPEGDSDLWIVATDSVGELQWEKIYGSNTEDERAYSIKRTLSGGYILGGHKGCSGYSTCDAWLVKLNSLGDTLWTKSISIPSWSTGFQSVIEINSSEYVMTGLGWGGSEYWNLWLLKTDSLGNEIWSKTYDYHNEYDIGYSVQQTSDGGFIVCGSGEWDVDYGWIIRTNDQGDILWTKDIQSYTLSPLANADTDCYSVIQAQNGDYIIAGAQTQISFQKEVMLLRIASDIVPVELTSFTATVTQNDVTLNWQTATETNNSGFEIERTSLLPSPYEGEGGEAGRGWDVVGFVPGFGTTTEPKTYSFTDEYLTTGKYQYRLKQIDFDGSFEYSNTVEVEINSPTEFSLEQNYPNPFNPTTKIKYTIPSTPLSFGEGLGVRLLVYDVLGNEVATLVNEPQQPGTYEVEFNSNSHSRGSGNLSSGVYYYQLRAGGFVETKKFIVLK